MPNCKNKLAIKYAEQFKKELRIIIKLKKKLNICNISLSVGEENDIL